MFKLAFLFVVLAVVVVTSNPHPRQNHSKKVSPPQKKHSAAHHDLDAHVKSATRVARSHGSHDAPLHHPHGGATSHHPKKLTGARKARGIHGANKGHNTDKKRTSSLHRSAKNRGHRK